MRFARKKSSIERLNISQFESYNVCEVGLPFGDSCKDLGILVDTELILHGHIRSIVGKSSGISVNLLNWTLCRSREFMLLLLEFGSCV